MKIFLPLIVFGLAFAFSAFAATEVPAPVAEASTPSATNGAPAPVAAANTNDVGEVPTSLPGVKIVTAEEAMKLIASKDAQAFDTRKNFRDGIIPGAGLISMTPPPRRGTKMILYSQGTADWSAYEAAKAASRNWKVYWLREGVDGWTGKGFKTTGIVVKQ